MTWALQLKIDIFGQILRDLHAFLQIYHFPRFSEEFRAAKNWGPSNDNPDVINDSFKIVHMSMNA